MVFVETVWVARSDQSILPASVVSSPDPAQDDRQQRRMKEKISGQDYQNCSVCFRLEVHVAELWTGK